MCKQTEFEGGATIPKAHELQLEYEPGELDGHHHEDEGSGNCGRAIVREFKRTVGTWWVKEMTNFNQKTVAVSFFIYFAAMAPAITFGAVYAKSTNNYIGPVEMITATAWCGILYALIGGQPMVSVMAGVRNKNGDSYWKSNKTCCFSFFLYDFTN